MKTRTLQSYSKKCLKSGVLFSKRKKIQKKASSSMIVKSYQSHMSCIMGNLIHMLLDISLSFVKFSDPSENLFMLLLAFLNAITRNGCVKPILSNGVRNVR